MSKRMRRMTTLRSLLVKRDISSHPHVNLTSTKVSHHKHLSIPLNTDINVLKILLLFCTVHKIYCRQTLMSIASITSQDRGGGDGSACVVLFIRVNPTSAQRDRRALHTIPHAVTFKRVSANGRPLNPHAAFAVRSEAALISTVHITRGRRLSRGLAFLSLSLTLPRIRAVLFVRSIPLFLLSAASRPRRPIKPRRPDG